MTRPALSTLRELRAGLETALQGLSTTISPLLILAGLLGTAALPSAYWAALVAASVVPLVRLLLGGHAALLPAPRAASLTTYATLVLQLSLLTPGGVPVGIALGTLLYLAASALVLLAGVLRLGLVFRMVPSPVAAGIGNGTALLLAWLALQQLYHAHSLAWVSAAAMLGAYVLWQWGQVRLAWMRALPAVLVAALLGLACAFWLEPVGTSEAPGALALDAGRSLQWWAGLDLGTLESARLLRVAVPGALTLALIMILETFTAAALMEHRHQVRADGNRELIALGAANMVGALLGGVPCSTSPLFSLSNRGAGGQGRRAALACYTLLTLALWMATPWLVALPMGLAAGLLLLQCGPLIDPVFRSQLATLWQGRAARRAQLSDLGFQITALISLIGFWGDLIWACLVGIGLSSLAVLKRVSRELTAQWAYLDTQHSRRIRAPETLARLRAQAHTVGVLQLTGHLFFGNTARLQQLATELDARAGAVVLDISQVHAVDPSGVATVRGLVQTLLAQQHAVHLCGLQRSAAKALRTGLEALPGVAYHPDLDRGLEACEDQVLARAGIAPGTTHCAAETNQLLLGLSEPERAAVLALGQPCKVASGALLFARGTPANGIWLIVHGQVSILADTQHDAARLATLGPGQFVGEMGLIDGQPRSASARADTAVGAWQLDAAAIATLVQQHPAAALRITRNIARELSLRLRSLTP